MQGRGESFVATQAINDPATGARAYNPGDTVNEGAVAHADWLVIGENVEPVAGAVMAEPAHNAGHAVWAAYAVSLGADAGVAEGLSRAQLIKATEGAELHGQLAPKPTGGTGAGG